MIPIVPTCRWCSRFAAGSTAVFGQVRWGLVAAVVVVSLPASAHAAAITAPPTLELRLEVERLRPRQRDDPTGAGATIGRARLEARPLVALEEVLRDEPGVVVQASGTPAVAPVIRLRGGTAAQLDVWWEQVPLNNAYAGEADLGWIPVPLLGAVDLYRSAPPLEVGGAALAGALVLHYPPADRDRWYAEFGSGSFGHVRLGAGGVARRRRWSLLGGVVYERTRGDFPYRDDRGTLFDPSDDRERRRANNDEGRIDALAVVQRRLAGGVTATVALLTGQRAGGIPGNGLREPTVARRVDRRLLGAATLAWGGSGEHGSWTLYGSWLEERQRDPLAEFGVDRNDTDDHTDRWGGALWQRWALVSATAGTLEPGLRLAYEWERYRPRDAALPWSEPVSRRRRFTVAVEPRWRSGGGRWTIAPLVRYTELVSLVSGRTLFGRPLPPERPVLRAYPSGRLGLAWRPASGWHLMANLALGQRPPSFLELFGDSAFVLPAPGLRPERGWTADLGLRHRGRRRPLGWALELVGFYRRVADLITFVRATSDTFVATNLDGARLWGAEVAAAVSAWRSWRFDLAYTLLRSRQESAAPSRDGKLVPLRPETTLTARLGWHRRLRRGYLRWVEPYGLLRHRSGNFLDPANLVAVPARTWGDLGLGTGWRWGRRELRARFEVRNVMAVGGFDLVGYPLPGRSWWLSLAVEGA